MKLFLDILKILDNKDRSHFFFFDFCNFHFNAFRNAEYRFNSSNHNTYYKFLRINFK